MLTLKRKKSLDGLAVSADNPIGSTIGHESTMSKLKFNCSHCGQRLECDDAYSGRQIPCPSCKAMTVVPGVAGKAAPALQKSGMTYVPEAWGKEPPAAGKL